MYDELDNYADITIRYAPQTTPNLGPHACVVLDIKGRNRKVSLAVPTGPVPQHITLATCDQWISIIQGPVLSGCGIEDDQREVLLHLFLAYCAFVLSLPGVSPDHWYRFASQLVILACEASAQECVDDHLCQILEWFHAALPVGIFLDLTIPPIVYNDNPPPAQLEQITIEPEGIPHSQQVALRRLLEDKIACLVFKVLRTVPEGTPPNIFSVRLIEVAREEDRRRANTTTTDPTDIEDIPLASPTDPLYLTVKVPAYLVGSICTPLVDLIQQCSIHTPRNDSGLDVFPIPTFTIPSMTGPPAMATPATLAATAPSTPPTALSTPPTAPSTPPTAPSTPPTAATSTLPVPLSTPPTTLPTAPTPAATSTDGAQATTPLGMPRATSSLRTNHPRGRAVFTARLCRGPGDIEAMIVQRRAAADARRARQAEERAARAAARAAQRAAARAAGEYVTDSDDSMPFLRTVTDSSDDLSELDLMYPGDN